jgi:hypothetical protein
MLFGLETILMSCLVKELQGLLAVPPVNVLLNKLVQNDVSFQLPAAFSTHWL